MNFHIHLRTFDDEMADAWREYFNSPDVTVAVGDILETDTDAILSPANSFGFMDGGIDLVYSHFFRWELQDSLRDLLASEYSGEIAVGQAVVVPTGNSRIPFLVSAPTMRVPAPIDGTANVYLAFRAALLAVKRHNVASPQKITSLASPALGAGIGAMPFDRVARQMHTAYREIVLGDSAWRKTARGVLNQHASLLR
nr:putative integron gene cassette protein [uncultured bacterium]